MNESEVKISIRKWILEKNGKIQSKGLRDDTPIIEQRIISSLQIMDLILFLEKLRGEAIDVENLKPGVFRTIDIIYNNFFKDRPYGKN